MSRSQQIHETESARVLRLQIISLGNDNNDLHLQSLHHQDRIDEQQGYLHERQDHITGLEENYERTKSDLRTRSREVDCLKVICLRKVGLYLEADTDIGGITLTRESF